MSASFLHTPVLLNKVLEYLNPQKKEYIIDGTFGAGGYSREILETGAFVIGIDQDPIAILQGQTLVKLYTPRLRLVQRKFSELGDLSVLAPNGVSGIVLDVGVSSMQLDNAERGFSFLRDGPLDMRMSKQGVRAEQIINQFEVKDLARIFYVLGEEKEAYRFARAIDLQRQKRAFKTTRELAELIEQTTQKINYKKKTIHPATKIFQALRIYINDELNELVKALIAAEKILLPGGRLVVVTFHSLEDRIVKRFFKARSEKKAISRYIPEQDMVSPSFEMLFKGVEIATKEEVECNPRARSAKLRAGKRTHFAAHSEDLFSFGLRCLPNYPGEC